MKKIGNDSVVSACTQRVSAIKKYLGAKDEIFVAGEQAKAGNVAQTFQDALDTRAAAVTAKGEYKSALAARGEADTKRLAAEAALQPYVMQRFGASSTAAHDFGYAPRKVADKTVVSKAKAALLNKATREARGTKGSKAKQQIKGSLSPENAAALEALSGSGGAAAAVAVASTPVEPVAAASTPVAAAAPAPVAAVANGVALNGAGHS